MTPEAGPGSGGDDREPLDEMEDDASLKAMRAVWLSMRAEEPGDGGLSALMAAAHAKAAEMRPPSLWARFAAVMRRPPALAFATVLVLVGGAVVVGQQAKDEPPVMSRDVAAGSASVEKDQPAMPSAPAAPPAAPPSSAPAAPAAESASAPAAPAAAANAPAPEPAPAVPASASAPAPVVVEQPARRAGSTEHAASEGKKPARKADDTQRSAPGGGPSDEEPASGAFDTGGSTATGAVLGGAAQGAASAPAPAPPPPPPMATRSASNAAVAPAPDPELESLERKARTAAAAGDCGTVQQLMSIIGKRAPQARERMAQQPAIQGCLQRTKAPAANADR